MKNFLEFLENENWYKNNIILCGIKFKKLTIVHDHAIIAMNSTILTLETESENFGVLKTHIKIVCENFPMTQTVDCKVEMNSINKKICQQNFTIKKKIENSRDDIEDFLERFLLEAINNNLIAIEELPKQSQDYFHEKRGKFISKNTGIV